MISSCISLMVMPYTLFKEINDTLESFNQLIDFLLRVVNSERCAYGSFYSNAVHKRLCAVMACPYRYSPGVKHLADVKRVNTFNIKRKHAYFFRRSTN